MDPTWFSSWKLSWHAYTYLTPQKVMFSGNIMQICMVVHSSVVPTLHLQNLASLVKKCRKQKLECAWPTSHLWCKWTATIWLSAQNYIVNSSINGSVDGWNPAPPGMYKPCKYGDELPTLTGAGFLPSTVGNPDLCFFFHLIFKPLWPAPSTFFKTPSCSICARIPEAGRFSWWV